MLRHQRLQTKEPRNQRVPPYKGGWARSMIDWSRGDGAPWLEDRPRGPWLHVCGPRWPLSERM